MNGDSVWLELDRAHGNLPFPGDGRETRALITWATKAMHAFAKIRHDTKHLYGHTAELRRRVLALEEERIAAVVHDPTTPLEAANRLAAFDPDAAPYWIVRTPYTVPSPDSGRNVDSLAKVLRAESLRTHLIDIQRAVSHVGVDFDFVHPTRILRHMTWENPGGSVRGEWLTEIEKPPRRPDGA